MALINVKVCFQGPSGTFGFYLKKKVTGLISEEVLLLQHKLAKDAHCEKRNDTLEIACNIFSC